VSYVGVEPWAVAAGDVSAPGNVSVTARAEDNYKTIASGTAKGGGKLIIGGAVAVSDYRNEATAQVAGGATVDAGLLLDVSAEAIVPNQIELDEESAAVIASRSRGTPRIANRLLRRVRDFNSVKNGPNAPIGDELARYALERLEVDEMGFDKLDQAVLLTLIEKFDGGPVGLDTLAAAIGEDKGTLEDLVEPFLIQGGFLDRTPRGRMATRNAFEHFGREPRGGPPGPRGRVKQDQGKLF